MSGFEAMIGKKVSVWGGVYIYTGVLTEVLDDCIVLEDASVVYETGELDSGSWKDAQKLPGDKWRVMKMGIESWGQAKC